MGYFSDSNINEVKPAGDSNKLGPGRYPRLRCSGKGNIIDTVNGKFFAVPFTVIEEPIQTDDANRPHKVGTDGEFCVNLADTLGYGKREAKSFAMAMMGTDDPTANVAGPLDDCMEGKWVGREISCDVHHKLTGKGNTIVKYSFSPVAGGAQLSLPVAPPLAPPPPSAPVEPPGGPWYPISGDPRGTFYNAQGQFR